MTFTTLDFETATSSRNSACEIGLTRVLNGEIVDTVSYLIQPPDNFYDSFNTSIHGIRRFDTTTAPTLAELWPTLLPVLEFDVLVAHNTGFDMSVLRQSLDYHNTDYSTTRFACSYALSKRAWSGRASYKLNSLCAEFGINLNHHRAGPDSRATAELMLHMLKHSTCQSVADLATHYAYSVGNLAPGRYSGCTARYTGTYRPPSGQKIVGDPRKQTLDCCFYAAVVVFTGTMSSMTRNEAKQIAAGIGATIQSGVSSKTAYLVVGQQDYRVVGSSGMSGKQKRAEALVASGQAIEVLSEKEFLELL